MASPSQTKRLSRARAPAAESDDVLRKIFLLLDSPADLARACTASPAFRRVITDPRFLRCFRALHPPPLLGIVSGVFLPAEPTHPSAAAARELVNAGDIDFSSMSFLPSPGPWYFSDSRDGRRLHYGEYQRIGCCMSHRSLGKPIVVSDPLHRRYLVLPAIPEDLAALVDHGKYSHYFKPILAPPADDEQDASFSARSSVEEDDEDVPPLSFRVVYLVQCAGNLLLFIFSSCGVAGGRQWRAFEFEGWKALGKELDDSHLSIIGHNYAHGRFYWRIYPGSKKMLVIDARGSMPEFSIMDFPSHARKSSVSVIFVEAAGEHEKLAMITIGKQSKEHHVYHLRYAVRREDNDGGDRWEPEAIIYLPLRFHDFGFIGVAGKYLLLEGTPKGWYGFEEPRPDIACFSLDLHTLQLEWFCKSRYKFIYASFYCGCPPYLSPLTV